YRLARRQLAEAALAQAAEPAQAQQVQEALRDLDSPQREIQQAGLEKLAALGPKAASAIGPLFQFVGKVKDPAVRERAEVVLKRPAARRAYPAAVVRQVEELATLHLTGQARPTVAADGRLSLTVRVAGNGANYLIVEPTRPLPFPLIW